MSVENKSKLTKIGFIGAGKVGHSLGKYFSEQAQLAPEESLDITVSGYYSKSLSSAKSAADFTNSSNYESFSDLILNSDIIFITVPDGMISNVWSQIYSEFLEAPFEESKLFCHCSGSLTSSIFENSSRINASTCSLHPMYAIADLMTSYKELSNAYFTFEGSDEAYTCISNLLSILPNSIGRVDADAKTLYHAACVFFSNLVVGLTRDGENLLRECGLDEEFARNAWHALFLDNAKNIVSKGTTSALTGPAERGDVSTIQSHLAELKATDNKDILSTYCTLTKSIVEIAEQKHPERDYSEIASLLDF